MSMSYNNLGNTDIKVSEVCLGSMTWGTQNTEAEGHAQIDLALDHGPARAQLAHRKLLVDGVGR